MRFITKTYFYTEFLTGEYKIKIVKKKNPGSFINSRSYFFARNFSSSHFALIISKIILPTISEQVTIVKIRFLRDADDRTGGAALVLGAGAVQEEKKFDIYFFRTIERVIVYFIGRLSFHPRSPQPSLSALHQNECDWLIYYVRNGRRALLQTRAKSEKL